MLRHVGQKRTFQHNLRLAILLCLTAGFVNTAGLLAFAVLTTNITGHAALLAIDLETSDFNGVAIVLLWLLLFLLGATFSSWYISFKGQQRRYVYTIPLFIEFCILCFVALYGFSYDGSVMQKEYFAGSLLFAMGMQNALVTVISKSVVRTTHLTGMVTDLGISLAEIIRVHFHITNGLKQRLILHGNIILFFLLGGIIGAFFFLKLGAHSFFIPSGFIIVTIFYDAFRMSYLKMKHHFTRKQRSKRYN